VTVTDPSDEQPERRGAAWIWWGLFAAIVAIFAISVASALMRNQRIPDRRGPPAQATIPGPSTGQRE
jgi:hypothetical protein